MKIVYVYHNPIPYELNPRYNHLCKVLLDPSHPLFPFEVVTSANTPNTTEVFLTKDPGSIEIMDEPLTLEQAKKHLTDNNIQIKKITKNETNNQKDQFYVFNLDFNDQISARY